MWSMLGKCPKSASSLVNPLLKRLCTGVAQEGFRPVYKFPYVRNIGLINRLKMYQTALSVVAVPSVGVLSVMGHCSMDDLIFTVILSLSGMIPLYGFGHFSNKLIGIIYINDEMKLVKMAYLDFWGWRRDIVMDLEDIVPFSEQVPTFRDALYRTVSRYSAPNKLKLCTQYGIEDLSGYNKIFPGEV